MRGRAGAPGRALPGKWLICRGGSDVALFRTGSSAPLFSGEPLMRKSLWILAAAPLLMLLAVPSAQAFATCKQISSMCPAEFGDRDAPYENPGRRDAQVPEPATIALFASGLGALGMSLFRRRKRD
jgi:PEP-CTERM motif